MPVLQTFNLELSPAISIPAWGQIANGTAYNYALYHQRSLDLGVEHEEHLGMPSKVSYPIPDDGEDEHGFVMVYQTDRIR